MTKSFCINCGEAKQDPHKKCTSCGFKPQQKLDIVKSVWLSTERCLSEKNLGLNQGPSIDELALFAKTIKSGKVVTYPNNEIELLSKQLDAVSEVSWLKVILVGLPFIIIPIIALALFIYKSF
jgi:hypothetical protein